MASDSFTNSDGTGLEVHDSNWTSISTTYNVEDFEINSNIVEHDGNWDFAGCYYDGSSEDESEAVDKAHDFSGSKNITVRAGADQRGYSCSIGGADGGNWTDCYINKNGAWLATLEVDGTWSQASDHTIKVTASGTTTVTIEGFVDDVSQGTTEDSSSPIGSGHPGFWNGQQQSPVDSGWDDWNDGAVGGTTYYQNTGQGAIAIVGVVAKKTSKFIGEHAVSIVGILSKKTTPVTAMGGHAMSIAGTLNKKTTPITAMGGHSVSIVGVLTKAVLFAQNTGGHAMTIIGVLTTAGTFVRAVGGHAMTIVGALLKKTSKGVGSGQVSPTGTLSKKTTSKFIGVHAVSIFGILIKKTTPVTAMGGHNMSIEGSLTKAIVVGQAAGGHAMTITGALTTIVTFVRAIGGHAMTIVGTLLKKTSKSMGGGQVASTGILSKKTSKDVGGGSVTSIGTLATAIMYTQAVGGASMSVIGSLATQFIAGTGVVAKFIRRRKTFYKQ